jgi:methyltransferase (TIGR00027 family)
MIFISSYLTPLTMTETTLIKDVSDTSLWVAYYRAKESKRKDALFKDPFAEKLVGERGKQIAEDMSKGTPYSEWTVTIRTVVIDRLIQKMLKEGVDMVVNLGAGMDTRPYRMDLPSGLKWIEVDYPHIIAHKEKLLKNEQLRCELLRIEMDLSDKPKRIALFGRLASESKKILVLTEGVVLYLTEEQTAELSDDLYRFPEFKYWIVEYIRPEVYPYMRNSERAAKLRNAPFQFFPADWLGFFEKKGWTPKEIAYLGEVGASLKRPMPTPRYSFLFRLFASKSARESMRKMMGFLVLERKK